MQYSIELIENFFNIGYWWYGALAIAVALVVIFIADHKNIDDYYAYAVKSILILYVYVILVAATVAREPMLTRRAETMFLWSYVAFVDTHNFAFLYENLCNILLFVPLGTFIGNLCKKDGEYQVTAYAFLLSVFIEIVQFFGRLGRFELDDIFHNVIGALIGYGLYVLAIKIFVGKPFKYRFENPEPIIVKNNI